MGNIVVKIMLTIVLLIWLYFVVSVIATWTMSIGFGWKLLYTIMVGVVGRYIVPTWLYSITYNE